jgi:hypothetical protein
MARTKKQLPIPGTEKETIEELDAAAEAYADARDERMQLTERESEAKEALVSVMKKHGLEVYRDENAVPPLIVTLIPGEDRVKVSRAKEEGEEIEGNG